MNRSSLLHFTVLLLPLIFFVSWSGSLAWQQTYSPTYEVVINGYDPRDIVYGKYIRFRYDWENPESQKPEDKDNLPIFGRFYVPENKAYNLEQMMRDETLRNKFKASVVIYGKKNSIKKLTIDGLSWQEALDGWLKTKHNQLK